MKSLKFPSIFSRKENIPTIPNDIVWVVAYCFLSTHFKDNKIDWVKLKRELYTYPTIEARYIVDILIGIHQWMATPQIESIRKLKSIRDNFTHPKFFIGIPEDIIINEYLAPSEISCVWTINPYVLFYETESHEKYIIRH